MYVLYHSYKSFLISGNCVYPAHQCRGKAEYCFVLYTCVCVSVCLSVCLSVLTVTKLLARNWYNLLGICIMKPPRRDLILVTFITMRHHLRSANTSVLLVATVRHWATTHFRCLQWEPGITCLLISGTWLHCLPAAENSELNCWRCLILLMYSQTLFAHYTAVLHIQIVDCSSLIYATSDIVRWSHNRNVIVPP